MEQLGGTGTATYYSIGNNRYSRKAYEAVVKGDPNWQTWWANTHVATKDYNYNINKALFT